MKWVLLDAMGVVYKTGDDTNDLLIPFIRNKNESIEKQVISDLYMQASLGQLESASFWKELGFVNEFPAIEQTYLNNFLELDHEIFEFFESIDRSSFKVAMLSNDVSEWSLYLRKKFRIDHLFDDFIISGDVKCRKPDSEIYKITISRLQAKPSDCVFVDDRPKNLKSAYELGLHTIFFDRDKLGRPSIDGLGCVEAYIDRFAALMPAINKVFESKS